MIIKIHDDPGYPVNDRGALWDTLEWSDQTLIDNPDARGLFVKMIAQSINDWAVVKQAQQAAERHAKERETAKEEVESKAIAIAAGMGHGHALD